MVSKQKKIANIINGSIDGDLKPIEQIKQSKNTSMVERIEF